MIHPYLCFQDKIHPCFRHSSEKTKIFPIFTGFLCRNDFSPGEVDLAEVGKTVFVFRFVQFPDHFQSEQTFFR